MESSAVSAWLRPVGFPPLGGAEVQVWKAEALDGAAWDAASWAACRALLTSEERARIERIRAGVARDESLLARACLRALLGRALGVTPGEVAIALGSHGKPCVEGVEFNVSHSRGIVLIALCRSAAVGVDVEAVDGIEPRIETLEIARQSFAAGERQRIEQAPEACRALEFCRMWTRKEAVVKAHGQGLSVALDSFDVSGEERDLVSLGNTPGSAAEKYFVRDLPLSNSFAGALAVAAGRTASGGSVGWLGGVRMYEMSGELLMELAGLAR